MASSASSKTSKASAPEILERLQKARILNPDVPIGQMAESLERIAPNLTSAIVNPHYFVCGIDPETGFGSSGRVRASKILDTMQDAQVFNPEVTLGSLVDTLQDVAPNATSVIIHPNYFVYHSD